MSTRAILAIDQGTTGSTALIISQDGRILGRGYSEFNQYFPKAGWVEHDAAEILEVTVRVVREALGAAGALSTATGGPAAEVRIEGIGITNQRETLVIWDRETGEPLHRAIVWQDRRTADFCAGLKEAGHEPAVRSRTGLVLDPYFSATKIWWLLENVPGLRRRAEAGELACGTVDAWLVHSLTTERTHATEPTNASRTLLYDLSTGEFEDELLDLFGVPRSVLPEIRPSAGDFGTADGTLLGIDAPISGVAGDQQAALFGQGCWSPGLAKNTYGTGAFLLLHTGSDLARSQHGLLTTVACDERGRRAFALEGSIFIAGAAVQWLRDELELLASASESEELASGLPENDGVYFVPAFVGLGAPYWNPNVRGTILGITRGTRKGHIVRAALEAMAYATAEVLEAMEADAGLETSELRVDGGAAENDWLMAFQAGILDIPVRRPQMVQTTALGAAGLAGLHVGLWVTGEEFLTAQGEVRIFWPEMGEYERSELKASWKQAVEAAISFAADG